MFLAPSGSCICPIQWSQVWSREWRCSWSSADRRCSNYIWVIDNFISYQGATYIRDLAVSHNFVHATIVQMPTRTAELLWHVQNWCKFLVRSLAIKIRTKTKFSIHPQLYFIWNSDISILWNGIENVICEVVDILFKSKCVKQNLLDWEGSIIIIRCGIHPKREGSSLVWK